MNSQFKFAGLGENPNYFQRPPTLGQSDTSTDTPPANNIDWNQDGVPDATQPPPQEFPTGVPWPLPAGTPPGYVPAQYAQPQPVSAWPKLPIIGELAPIFQLLILGGGAWFAWRLWQNREERAASCKKIEV